MIPIGGALKENNSKPRREWTLAIASAAWVDVFNIDSPILSHQKMNRSNKRQVRMRESVIPFN